MKNSDIEKEIFNAIQKITKENSDKGYSWHIGNYREEVFKRILSEESFEYLKKDLSVYGTFACYCGNYGTPYNALRTSKVYRETIKKL